ncbi:MAG: ABC transporter ATP-binding protein [Planctomycetes bacterium]|nr:ABC transporter ATP-binding protein [Planctomycetota bacterium]
MPDATRSTPDPFWRFARSLLRYRALIVATCVFVLLSGLTLSAGLLGAMPVMEAILGKGRNLVDLAKGLNETLAHKATWATFAQIPEHIIAGLPTDRFVSLAWIMGGLAVLTAFGAACNFMHAYASLTVVNRAVTDVRRRAFHTIIRAPLWTVLRNGTAEPISRIVNDSAQLANGLTVLLSKAVLQVVKGIAALAVALAMEWRVTVAALLIAPLLAVIIRQLGKRIKKAANAALQSQAGLYGAAAESLQALRVVKVHTTERMESGRFHRMNKQMLGELNRVRTAKALASPLTEALSIFLLCGLVLLVGRAVIASNVDPGRIILSLTFLAVAGASLKPLTGIIGDIQQTHPAARRLAELLDSPPEPGHGPGLARLPAHRESIVFDGVSVMYPGAERPALRRVSLRVEHGQRIAVVGANGCGKTTLLGLVPRLYDPSEGRVLIDGRDIREFSVRSLRTQLGMVAQETVLFRGSVLHNIVYGSGASREQAIAAAKRARAHEFISAMPQGYDSLLGEAGGGLSGGQRQRLAIARAILRDPAILILDEATSMIDADSEAGISAALAEFCIGRTALIVAHRLSTVLTCDRIVVLREGELEDQGTHEELLGRCETYRSLARHQFLIPEIKPREAAGVEHSG